MKKTLIVLFALICACTWFSNSFAQQTILFHEIPNANDSFKPLQEGLRDLRESAIQRQQLELQRQQLQAIQQQNETKTATTLPMISANGFDCGPIKNEIIGCVGSFERMTPKLDVGAFAPKAVTLIANGIDTDTGKPATFYYESLTGCVQINYDEGGITIDRSGKVHSRKGAQKIKGCLN